ncbi:MAG TPA: hypothetical protein VHK91_15925 [Flavisolibacter sp.]|jgi:hypothetical protein|nr:hypothetical protein [Flavisolibacter sp.]
MKGRFHFLMILFFLYIYLVPLHAQQGKSRNTLKEIVTGSRTENRAYAPIFQVGDRVRVDEKEIADGICWGKVVRVNAQSDGKIASYEIQYDHTQRSTALVSSEQVTNAPVTNIMLLHIVKW